MLRLPVASELKIARVYKNISQEAGSTLPVLMTCFFMRDILCNVQDLK